MQTEEELIRQCCKLIERRLNWGPGDRWSNHDFEQLGDKIFEKTKTKLSVSTLKRVWGKVNYDSVPTTSTLNALAQFSDFNDWRDYVSKNLNRTDPDASPSKEVKATWIKRPVVRKLVFMLTLILLGILTHYLMKFFG